MVKKTNQWTRRQFLGMVGMLGGSAALYESMVMLDLIPTPQAYRGPPQLSSEIGQGQRVLILGAGIGGLTTAYELSKAGFTCQILEVNHRAGGRNRTVRQNDLIEQIDMPSQLCRFDEGQYFNTGPGRIPYHHQALLGYCQQFGVDLQVYVMENRAALFHSNQAFGGQPVTNRRVAHDTRGYIAELLAKAINQDSLDQELSGNDKEKMLGLLQQFGQLNNQHQYEYSSAYQNNWRAGYKEPVAVVDDGVPMPKLELSELLNSEFWDQRFYQPDDYEWQATMFQPVGGMDQVVKAFLKEVGALISYNADVINIQNDSDEVRVTYKNSQMGEEHTISADFCVSNIPLPILAKIIKQSQGHNFSEPFIQAVNTVQFANTCKVGWQANHRFWESAKNQIYGGITWTNQDITQIWYPSADYFSQKGVLTGCYNFGLIAERFGNYSLQQRLEEAMQQATQIHPEFSGCVPLELGLSVAWQKVPHQLGGWANWPRGSEAQYNRLLRPDKGFFITGDQVSYLPGWQEGAILSAQHVTQQINALVSGQPLDLTPVTQAPCPPDRSDR